jgi:hypothetical protein
MLFADRPNEWSTKESLPTAIISSAVGHSQQSAKTSFADCLAGGKGGGAPIAVPFATCLAVRQSAKTPFYF